MVELRMHLVLGEESALEAVAVRGEACELKHGA